MKAWEGENEKNKRRERARGRNRRKVDGLKRTGHPNETKRAEKKRLEREDA